MQQMTFQAGGPVETSPVITLFETLTAACAWPSKVSPSDQRNQRVYNCSLPWGHKYIILPRV